MSDKYKKEDNDDRGISLSCKKANIQRISLKKISLVLGVGKSIIGSYKKTCRD